MLTPILIHKGKNMIFPKTLSTSPFNFLYFDLVLIFNEAQKSCQ